MLPAVKLIGAFIACVGLANIINPALMRRMLGFWRQGKRLYLGAVIRLLFGAVFLAAANSARVPLGLYIIGGLVILGGVLIFVMGPEKIRGILDWWEGKPDAWLRLAAVIVLAFGVMAVSFS